MMNDLVKKCNGHCGKYKSFSEFHKSSKSPDGLQGKCKECIREYQQSRVFQPELVGVKWCPSCEIEKPVNEFYIEKRRRSGRSSWCMVCILDGERKRDDGYVYFALAKNGLLRIGFTSKDPYEYVEILNSQSATRLDLIGCIKHENAQQLCTEIKYRYAKYHSRGIWFKYTGALKHFVQKRLGIPKTIDMLIHIDLELAP